MMVDITKILAVGSEYEQMELSLSAYIILALVISGLLIGLCWCFYRAITAADSSAGPQVPEDIGDENNQKSK